MPGTAVSPPVAEARGKTRWWQALPLDRAGLVLGPLVFALLMSVVDIYKRSFRLKRSESEVA